MLSGSTSSRLDVYRRVTDTIVARIEAGAGTYEMPWHHDGSPASRPRSAVSGDFYRGINVLVLWAAAKAAGYPTGLWATYRQWKLVDGHVRQGERGHLVVLWKPLDPPPEASAEAEGGKGAKTGRRVVARGFWVFNLAQVEGYSPAAPAAPPETVRNAMAEQFHAALGIETRFGGDDAFYQPEGDYVQLPPFERFRDGGAFYGTLFHEAAHATGAPHRLNRDLTSRFGSEAYAFEELIAEWAAAMVCMTLDLTPEPRGDHAQYITSWLKVLKSDTRAVFTAASHAQKVVDWMWDRKNKD
jgi:antirestriction protein ArdC